VVQWIAANRLATLVGALILLALILYVLLGLRRRGEDGAKGKRLKALKAQPKVPPKVEPTQYPEPQAREIDRKPALAAAAGLHSSELTKPSIATPVAGQHEQREEEEREVFEL
jgi:hypothetical protein